MNVALAKLMLELQISASTAEWLADGLYASHEPQLDAVGAKRRGLPLTLAPYGPG